MIVRRLGALGAILLLVAGCSVASGADETAEGSGGELQATTWVLRSYAVDGALTIVPDGLYADADFRANRVKGFAGCNDYDAVYRSGGRLLLIGMAVTTRLSCGDVADAFETAYLTNLGQARSYNIRADALVIRAPDRSVLLVFDAAPNNPLLGSWVVDSYATTPGSQSAPLEGTELTAVFRLVTVSGSAGCNTYQGPYTTNGALAAIGPLASTQKACPDDVMAQEAAFLAALQGVGRIETRAQTVNLEDLTGNILVALSRPSAAPAASPSAAASANPTRTPAPSATPKPSPSPSPTPTATPTASPTATPTAAPTPTPVASSTPAPTVKPPASVPAEANCTVTMPAGSGTATIVYPADWNTVAQPPALACRYFDPEPITVPADPATLSTAVMIKTDVTTSYEDALTAATNPTAWNVLTNEAVTVSGLPASRIEATSTAGSPGYPAGTTRYGYLIDMGPGSAWIETSGTVGDATYTTNMSVVDLIASESTITAGS